MKYIRRSPFLVATLVALMLSGVFFLLEKGAETKKSYLASIQERVNRQVDLAMEDLQQVADSMQAAPADSATALLTDSHYPYYVFKNGRLHTWSDHRLVPEYHQLTPYHGPAMISLPQGQFILLGTSVKKGGDRYDLFSLISLYRRYRTENDYLQSGFNQQLFPVSPRSVQGPPFNTSEVIVGPGGEKLFSVQTPAPAIYKNHSVSLTTIFLLLLSAVLFGIHVIFSVRKLRSRHRYGFGLLLLAAYLLVLRGLMLRFSIPFVFFEGQVFNPEYYYVSTLVPSLGDMLFNSLAVSLLLLYAISIYFRTISYQWLIHQTEWVKRVFSFLVLVGSYVVFYAFYQELINIYEKSNFSLDITLSISFSPLKIACLLVFVLYSLIYFLVLHLIVCLFLRLNKTTWIGLLFIAGTTLAAWLLAWLLDIRLELIFLAHTLYLFILYLMRLPRAFNGFKYPTTIYYFLGAIICALVTTHVVHQQEIRKDVLNKMEFGQQLLNENDPYTEFLLKKANDAIAADNGIHTLFSPDFLLSRELIQQKIKSTYLDNYLDKYDVEVLSFDASGRSLDNREEANDLSHYRRWFQKPDLQTEYNSIYFINQPTEDIARQYVSFVPVRQDSTPLGTIILNLSQPEGVSDNTYPELLLDKRFVQAAETREYSYAIYGPSRRLYSSGTYNYDRRFPTYLLADSLLYDKGISLNSYRHVGKRGVNDRKIVVSSKEWSWKGVLANFSFLYLILVLFIAIFIAANTIRHGLSSFKLTYSTKIQVLLNAAFIFPLLIVLFFILKVIHSNFAESQEGMYLNNTHNIASTISGIMSEYRQGKMSKAYLEQEVQQIAREADIDINIYTTQGSLMMATKPLIYQSGLLSNYINPEAYEQIIEDKDNQVLLTESLGSKVYSTSYVGLKSDTGELLGVVGIPYFNARSDLDRQIIDIVASVLIVFTAMLLVFLAVSYFASNLLIRPLRVITRKIGKTNLNQLNEPIDWSSQDEIGLLIRQYNRMLVNLEENKQVLSANEKQSAWREMAKQVAHEIKNPLTPMKLTLQQLQRTIRRDDPQALERVSRAMESIIEQIDNIGHIAQSFSDIAKMPLPQKEVFEVTSVITKASELYANDTKIFLQREIQEGPVYISGDRQLFGSTISNLIINARQSVPDTRRALISIRLYTHDDDVMIEIKDNGSGIPVGIRNRVFLPNFTTREGGSGLGLAMAKRIIEHAGGSIWFETEEDTGTTFYLSIPLVEQLSQNVS